jgi:hypothetical protein
MASSEYQYVELELDSLDSNVTDARYAKTDWPTFFFVRPIANVAYMKILSAEIPFSYYVIDTHNNTFILSETGTVATSTVVIPVGNYTSSTLATALSTALTTASTGLTSKTYTVTFSSQTGKFTFSSNASVSSPFSFSFGSDTSDPGNRNPRFVLGFPGGTTTSTSVSSPTLVAPGTAQISGPNYVYVNSDSLGQLSNNYLPTGAQNLGFGGNGPQMARIPINCLPGEVAFYTDPDPHHWFDMENLNLLTQVDFYLTLGNQNGQEILRLNGQNFSLKVGLMLQRKSKSYMGSSAGGRMIMG